MSEADTHAEEILAVLDHDGLAMVMLSGYRIGDDYETPCVATSLTVSREHFPDGLARVSDELRGVAYFPPELVPSSYRHRSNENGRVPVALAFELDDVSHVLLHADGPQWRSAAGD